MRFDPLGFDRARLAVARALARPPGSERTAVLAEATRTLIAFGLGHPTLTRACAELGWHDELVDAVAGELVYVAKAPDAERLVAIGTRIDSAFTGDEARLRALVSRTCDRLKEPTSVVRQAIAAAAPATSSRMLVVADDALATWLRAHFTPSSAAGLLTRLVDALAQLPEAGVVRVLSQGVKLADREVLVDQLTRRLDVFRDTLPGDAAGWIASALVLLPHSDAVIGDAVRALQMLPEAPRARRIALELLAAVLPDAVSSPDRLAFQRHGKLTTLWHDGSGLQLIEGDPESSLTTVRHDGATTHWTRRRVADVVTVIVSVTRSMGDSIFEISIERPDTGAKVSFLFECPDSIAIHRSGAWVWHQTMTSDGRRHEVHDLGTGTPAPYARKPPRSEVILASEAIGAGCPTMFGASFLFEGDAEKE